MVDASLRVAGTPANAAATSLSLVIPATAQSGDYLIAFLRDQNSSSTVDWTPPSGWVRIGAAWSASSTAQRVTGMWGHRCASGEPGTTVTFNLAGSNRKVGYINAYQNVDSTTPVSASTGWYYTSVTSTSIPAWTAAAGKYVIEQWVSEFVSPNSYSPVTTSASGLSAQNAAFRAASGTQDPPGPEGTGVSRTAMRNWGGLSSGTLAAHTVTQNSGTNPSVQLIALNGGYQVPVDPTYRYSTTPYVSASGTPVKSHAFVKTSTAFVPAQILDWRPKPGYTSLTNMLSYTEFYIAHRGGSRDYCEMSSRAYLNAGMRRFGAYELSLARSSDGVYFGLHDASLDRTSYGTGGGSGTTYVASTLTWAQIQASPGILGSNAANNTSQPAQPYMRFEDYLKYYGDRVCFLDLKAITATAQIDEILNIMDANGGTSKWVAKYYGVVGDGTTTWMGRAKARGYKTWGYFYAADSANYATYAPKWDYLGMDYTAAQTYWDQLAAAAPGKRIIGHICPDATAVSTARTAGATAFMCSGIESVTPTFVAAGTTKHRVYGSGAAVPAATSYTDGTPNIRLGTLFYCYTSGGTTIPNSRCVGGRLYVPTGSTLIGATCTMYAYVNTSQTSGWNLAATPQQSKAMATTLVAGWNEVLWDTPFTMGSVSAGGNFVMIAYELTGTGVGKYLAYTGMNADPVVASDGSRLALSDSPGSNRSYFRIGTGSTTNSGTWYGTDIVVDEGP